ncbi:RHS repeat-associated core domain-containing protein [Variovorax sp.]|jgi:RHS repeat-associated protein|uniref:RHS repeat-associated core domain-containing protein n=1 Tax=Variovorax sp. TaxID=1871043 RepID=UPI000C45771A|nr:RHS repeat-associated core domain-containing protein [Variovorax sp.]MBS75853.1 hypothetical protein [Variovorax sp.]
MAAPEQAEKRHEHFALAKAPDWKYTPLKPDKGVPVPYWTISYFDESVQTASRSDGRTNEYFLDRSRVPVSRGGEAGKGKGVMSGTYMDEFEPKEWSQTLHIDGGLAVFNGHMGTINKGNAPAKVYTSINPEQAIADKACWEQMKTNMAALGVASKDRMFADPAGCGKDLLSGAWNTITGDVAAVGDMLGSVWGGIKAFFSDPLGSMSSAVDGLQKFGAQAVEAGKQVVGVINGLRDGSITMDDLLDFAADMLQDQLCEIAAQVEEMVKQGKGCEAVGVILGQTAEAVAVSLATAGVGAAAGGATKAAQLMAKAGITKGDDIAAAIRKLKEFKKKHKERPHEGGEPHPRRLADGEDSSTPGDRKPDVCPMCPVVGKPVNPVLGCKVLGGGLELDFDLPAPLPLPWQRTYVSRNARVGWLGQGWTLPLGLVVEERRIQGRAKLVLVDESGRDIVFPALKPGASHYNEFERFTLRALDAQRLQLEGLDGEQRFVFRRFPGGAGRSARYLLASILDRNDNRIDIEHGPSALPERIVDSAGRVLLLGFEHVVPGAREPLRLRKVELLSADGGRRTPLVGYEYDRAGDLVRVTDRLGGMRREFEYRNHVLVAHTEPGGLRASYAYDVEAPNGRVRCSEISNGERYDFEYLARATRVTDQLGRVEVYEFNADREWTATVDAMGGRTVRQLDAFGRLLALTDPAGRTTRYGYDERGRPVRVQVPGATDTEFVVTTVRYDTATGQPASLADALGATTGYRYDARGNLVEVIDALGQPTRYRYDDRGLPVAIVDALGKTRHLSYNAAGQVVRQVDCSGQPTGYGYDEWGRLESVTDALGHTTRYQRDELGRLRSLVGADGTVERFEYDAAGRLTAHVSPLGARTEYLLALDGLPLVRRNAAGGELRYEYDGARRLVALYNENAVRYDFGYDALGRLVEETGFDGRHTRYVRDPAGLLLAKIELGCLTLRQRLDQRLAREQSRQPGTPQALPPRRTAPTFEDPWGFGLTDEVTAAAASAAGQAIVTRYERDAGGRLVHKLVAGHVLDARGRRVAQHKSTHYRHDAAGRLVEASNDNGGRISLGYDAMGQLLEETRVGQGLRTTQRHRYDALGNRLATVLPDGREIRWLHYGSGHLHQINLDGRVVCDIERDALHREVARSQGALESRYRYDPVGRLLAQATARPRPDEARVDPGAGTDAVPGWDERFVLARQYVYDPGGNLLELVDRRHGRARYGYDRIGRLLSALQPMSQEQFAFDPAHNLLPGADAGGGAAPSAGAIKDNRVEVFEDKRYRYDSHGNLVEKRIGRHTRMQFEWDVEHQLQGVTVVRQGQGGSTTTQTTRYRYDAFGRRIEKSDRLGRTLFEWDGNRLLSEQRGALQTLYLYQGLGFVPVAQVQAEVFRGEPAGEAQEDDDEQDWQPRRSRTAFVDRMLATARQIQARSRGEGEAAPVVPAQDEPAAGASVVDLDAWRIRYYHTDHLGTPRELSSEDGEIVWSASYKAWGNTLKVEVPSSTPRAGTQPVEQNLRFQGQYFDAESGLHYSRFRYYDPDVGRFVSEDPIGLAGGENFFAYAPNPIGWIDPYGLAGVILLGEGQDAVEAVASRLGARTIKNDWPDNFPNLKGVTDPEEWRRRMCEAVDFNRQWIRDRAAEGYTFQTIGVQGSNSPYYAAELEELSKLGHKATVVKKVKDSDGVFRTIDEMRAKCNCRPRMKYKKLQCD